MQIVEYLLMKLARLINKARLPLPVLCKPQSLPGSVVAEVNETARKSGIAAILRSSKNKTLAMTASSSRITISRYAFL